MRYEFKRVSQSIDSNLVIIEGREIGGFGLSLVISKCNALDLALQIMARLGYAVDYWEEVHHAD